MFYNTIHIKDTELKSATAQTLKQDAIILKYFELNPYSQKTGLELADELNILFTSVRRSVTNLIAEGKLKYTGMKMERYGKPNHLICLKIDVGQTKLEL